MAEKVYIFKRHKAMCLVVQPMGKRDAVGNKIPRVAYQFAPNAAGMAEFKTSDPKAQAAIEKEEEFKIGHIILYTGGEFLPEVSPNPVQKTGGRESGDKNPPKAPAANKGKPKGARIGKR